MASLEGSRGEGADRPGWLHTWGGGGYPDESVIFCSWIYKEYQRNDHLEGAEAGSGGDDCLKRSSLFRRKNRVTPSDTAPDDTKFSDATELIYNGWSTRFDDVASSVEAGLFKSTADDELGGVNLC